MTLLDGNPIEPHKDPIAAPGVRDIARLLAERQFRYVNEANLQDGIEKVLKHAGYAVHREVRLNDRDRIDFVVDRIGIEVKIASSGLAVQRQLNRYAESPLLDGLVLVTTRTRHSRSFAVAGGKPVEVVCLVGAWSL